MVPCTNPFAVSTGGRHRGHRRGPAAARTGAGRALPPVDRRHPAADRGRRGHAPHGRRMAAAPARRPRQLGPAGPGPLRPRPRRPARPGTRPGLTLLDRSLPPWLDAAGGWLARDTAEHFAEYAAELGRRFGDRVERWITSSDLAAPHSPTMWPECIHRAVAPGGPGWPPSITSCSPTASPPRHSAPPGRGAGSGPRSPWSAGTPPPTTPTTVSPWSAWRAGPTASSWIPCCSAPTW